MSTMPIDEAARQIGVSESTLRTWVLRGHLEPVRRGAKPLRFDEDALAEAVVNRMSKAEHARLDAMWAEVLANS